MNEKIKGERGDVVNNNNPSEPQLLGFIPCDFGLGLVTCFGQWDISKHDASRGLVSTCILGFVFL